MCISVVHPYKKLTGYPKPQKRRYNDHVRLFQYGILYKECDVLVLDDIGAQAGSKWQEQELFNLVNKRMEHGKITIYTSNMDANALNVDARTRDRIIKTSIVLQMPEENLRKKKAAAEQQSFLQMILQQQGR